MIKEQYRLLWNTISSSNKMRKATTSTCDKKLSVGCALVYTWLLPWCDDDGRMRAEISQVKSIIFPYISLTEKEMDEILTILVKTNLITIYEVDGERFLQIIDWEPHQRIRKDRYKPSTYPEYTQMTTTCQPNDNQSTTYTIITPTPSPTPTPSQNKFDRDRFELFWTTYPKKRKKPATEKAWKAIKFGNGLFETIMDALSLWSDSEDWRKDDGKYIPYPNKWLNERGWEDELSGKDRQYRDMGDIDIPVYGEKRHD